MPIHNADVAVLFDEAADILELEEANPFRIRAYRNAARVLRDLNQEVQTLVERGEDLTTLPSIGEDLAGKIREIVTTGHSKFLRQLRKQVAPGLTALLKIPGLGPRRVKTLHDNLAIHTVTQLGRAARKGLIHDLPGFGVKTEQSILESLAARSEEGGRFKLALAAQYAEPLVQYLKELPGVKQVTVAGSYRRRKETVGDLDILVTAGKGVPVMDHFIAYDEVAKVTARGRTRATVILRAALQVDLRLVAEESYGAALHYFTGSKAHNIAIRHLGQQAGLKINEYGIFRGPRLIAGQTEASVFASVGLPCIPPELREDRGEIEAARANRLPVLVERTDLQGDLHSHTKATDGHNSLREMAEAARQLGLAYLAVTDHSQRMTVTHGLNPRRLLAQGDEIDRLNEELRGITLLKGIEVDILEDGSLDLPDSALAHLDLVVGAVHSHFRLSRDKQTERILRAMDHPYFTLLAHPTGRLIQQREAYDVDMERIIRHARSRGCFLELNAHAERLDLPDVYCRMAGEEGVLVSINSDAHTVQDFQNLSLGVGQARRGWLEQKDVLNTRSLQELRTLLAAARGGND